MTVYGSHYETITLSQCVLSVFVAHAVNAIFEFRFAAVILSLFVSVSAAVGALL